MHRRHAAKSSYTTVDTAPHATPHWVRCCILVLQDELCVSCGSEDDYPQLLYRIHYTTQQILQLEFVSFSLCKTGDFSVTRAFEFLYRIRVSAAHIIRRMRI